MVGGGIVLYGVVWSCGIVRYAVYCREWCGSMWQYGMVWYGIVLYGISMIWHDFTIFHNRFFIIIKQIINFLTVTYICACPVQ